MASTLQANLNRVISITDPKKFLDAPGAANVWAGTTNLDLLGALNAKASTSGLGLNDVCNKIAGTTNLDAQGASEYFA